MNAYIYQAALYCEDCTQAIKAELQFCLEGESEYTFDSNNYPKGPFPEGGGEADSPNHCDRCGIFLENPITLDGMQYIIESLYAFWSRGEGNREVLEEWYEFYSSILWEGYH